MAMTHLLSNAPKVLNGIDVEKKDNHQITPKWMTPLLLFIDLHEKVILGMNRRTALGMFCSECLKILKRPGQKKPPGKKIISRIFLFEYFP